MMTLFSAGLPVAALFLGGCGTESAVIVPEGTALVMLTTSVLSTETMESGQPFTASLVQPWLHDGREIAAKGSRVEGKLVESDDGGRVKGVASLTVRMTGLQVGGPRK